MPFSFDLTPEQEKLKRDAAEFSKKEIAPVVAEMDEKDDSAILVATAKKLARQGYAGWLVPKEYGGQGRSLLDACIILEELVFQAQSATPYLMSLMVFIGGGPVTYGILKGGNEEQKRRLVPELATGEKCVSFCLTEPGMGSDAAAVKTTARLEGNSYILNGRKRYVTFAHVAEYHGVVANMDIRKGAKGIGLFIVPKGTPGFSVVERVPCLGMRGHQDEEVLLENCRLPKENLIGKEGEGLRLALSGLDKTRTTVTSGYIGLARAALEASVKFSQARKAFGQPISDFQAISFPLTEIAVGIEAARLLLYKAAWLAGQDKRHSVETATAKVLASELLLRATSVAIDVHGGFGCTKRFSVERMFRDGRIWVFAQGAPNIMKLIVMRDLFSRLEPDAKLLEELAERA